MILYLKHSCLSTPLLADEDEGGKVTEVFEKRVTDVLERRVSFKDLVEEKAVAKPSPLITSSTMEEVEEEEEGEGKQEEGEKEAKKGKRGRGGCEGREGGSGYRGGEREGASIGEERGNEVERQKKVIDHLPPPQPPFPLHHQLTCVPTQPPTSASSVPRHAPPPSSSWIGRGSVSRHSKP